MKTVLIPTDFSKNAWNTINYALQFFKDEKCIFYFLNTYTPPVYRVDYLLGGPAYSAIPDTGIDLSLAGLQFTLEEVKQRLPNPNHQFEILSAFNTLTGEINDICKKMQVDFIVMGTQGATGAKEILLGSNTVHVIRKAKVPVMIIPSDLDFKVIKSVLFATDYLMPFKKEEMQFIKDFAQAHKAKLTVMHVKTAKDLTPYQLKNKGKLRSEMGDFHPTFDELEGRLMPESIHGYGIKHPVDLLVMINRGHGYLERLLRKQNVESIAFHINIPFLVLPEASGISPKNKKHETYSDTH